MQRVYETPSHATSEALGFFAYGALAAMTRLAKDGDQAPTIDAHIAHMEMADRAFQFFTQMGVWARHRGLDLAELADEYSGMFDDIDMRTRPSQWWERSVKTYVTLGILSDLMREVAVCHKLFDDVSESWDLGQGAWVEEHLAPLTAQDGQLAARLSLWAWRARCSVWLAPRCSRIRIWRKTATRLMPFPPRSPGVTVSAWSALTSSPEVVHL